MLALAVSCGAPCASASAQAANGLAPPTGGSETRREIAPSETAPRETAPSETAPSETAPSETAPRDTAPSETAPSETAPSETAPSETAPSEDEDGFLDPGASDPSPETPTVDPSDFDAAERDLGQARTPWVLDDGVTDAQVPWDDFDPGAEYTPRDPIHLGAQLRFGALPGGAVPLPDGPLVELGGILDGRYSPRSPWHLRVVLAASFQLPGDENLGAGVHSTTSPFALKIRLLPIAVDLEQWGALRAGAEIGVQYVPQLGGGGEWEMLPGFSGEAVVRLLDGRLEVGAFGGIQWTAVGRSSRSGYSWRLELEGVIGVTVGYLLL
jgi:hypothetical protein